jgi:hypothetical protein
MDTSASCDWGASALSLPYISRWQCMMTQILHRCQEVSLGLLPLLVLHWIQSSAHCSFPLIQRLTTSLVLTRSRCLRLRFDRFPLTSLLLLSPWAARLMLQPGQAGPSFDSGDAISCHNTTLGRSRMTLWLSVSPLQRCSSAALVQ